MKHRPKTSDLKINVSGADIWDVAGVFNWSRRWRKNGALKASELGIAPDRGGVLRWRVGFRRG
jgi:hypothetical protein